MKRLHGIPGAGPVGEPDESHPPTAARRADRCLSKWHSVSPGEQFHAYISQRRRTKLLILMGTGFGYGLALSLANTGCSCTGMDWNEPCERVSQG